MKLNENINISTMNFTSEPQTAFRKCSDSVGVAHSKNSNSGTDNGNYAYIKLTSKIRKHS